MGFGAPQQCSLGTAACYFLFMLTFAILMTSLVQRFNGCDVNLGCIGPPQGGNVRWIGTEAGIAPDPTWSTGVTYGGGDPNSTVWNPASLTDNSVTHPLPRIRSRTL